MEPEQICVSEDAPLAAENRADSEEALVEPRVPGPSRSSNSHAVKIAVITTLICLLVSAQAFTAYMVFDQRQQIQGLQTKHQELQGQMSRKSSVSPQKNILPISDWPVLNLFDDLSDESSPTPEATTPPSVEEELREFMKDVELPHFNQSFLNNLQAVRQNMDESSWKEFESWLRYWLLFQMAQKNQKEQTPKEETPNEETPKEQTTPIAEKTKCQIEAGSAGRLLGSFRPQCDEQGNYRPKQCWPSTGECWCVDLSGVQISHITRGNTRNPLDCDEVRSIRSSRGSVMMPLQFDPEQQIQ